MLGKLVYFTNLKLKRKQNPLQILDDDESTLSDLELLQKMIEEEGAGNLDINSILQPQLKQTLVKENRRKLLLMKEYRKIISQLKTYQQEIETFKQQQQQQRQQQPTTSKTKE